MKIDGEETHWYQSKVTKDEETGETIESYVYIYTFNTGEKLAYRISFITDNRDNYKVTNIMNWLMGTIRLTSF